MQTGASEEKAVRLLEPGDMFGDYTVEKLLGQGGMGAVYLVRAPGGERYAVKVMFPEMVKKGSDKLPKVWPVDGGESARPIRPIK